MPMYRYLCAESHETDHLHRFSDGERPHTIDCRCGLPAWYRMAPPAPPTIVGRKAPREGRQDSYERELHVVERGGTACAAGEIRCPDIECQSCHHRFYEALIGDEALPACPRCGATTVKVVPRGVSDGGMRRYPYFDRGLGMTLTSPGHRAQVCREKGLIPVDGDWDAERMVNNVRSRDERQQREYDEYVDLLDHHPGFANYREARDKGRMP